MAKDVLKNLLASILLIFCISCSIPPSYSRREIDKVIKDICRQEFGLEVGAWIVEDTVWVYASFEKLLNDQGQWVEEIDEDLRHISLTLSRAFMNMDDPPAFYCLIFSDIKEFGLDVYSLGFIPNRIKFDLGLISMDEINKQTVFFNFSNIDALGDNTGKHIKKYDISMIEFITLLIQQNIEAEFLYSENKDNYKVEDLNIESFDGEISVSFDIMIKDYGQDYVVPLARIEEITKRILDFYTSFHDVTKVIIKDSFREKIKEIKITSRKGRGSSIKHVRAKARGNISLLRKTHAYVNKAVQYYREGNIKAAKAQYEKALVIYPENVNVLIGLGDIYLNEGNYEESLLFLEKALVLKPDYYQIEITMALSYIELGQNQKALEFLNKVSAKDPQDAFIQNSIAYAYLTLGDNSKALIHYQKLLKLDSDFPEIYKYLGYIHSRLENYGQAIESLEKAIENNSNDFESYYELGSIYTTLMKYSDATNNFQKTLAIENDYAPAHASLGFIYGYLGQIKQAKESLKKAKELFRLQENKTAIADIDQYLKELPQ